MLSFMAVRKTRRPREKARWSPQMEEDFILRNWSFNRRLVLAFTYLFLLCLGSLFLWHFAKMPGYPPLLVWAILLGSFALAIGLALVFWRCPSCGEVLYRTSKSEAGVLFWLSDPPDCPYCGVKLIKSK